MTAAATPEVVFQPHKAQRSGLWGAVRARVPIYIRKQLMLEAVQRHDPPRHHVMVDDKPRRIIAMKQTMRHRLTTVFVRRWHYPLKPARTAGYPAADFAIGCIGVLADVDPQRWLRAASTSSATYEKLQ